MISKEKYVEHVKRLRDFNLCDAKMYELTGGAFNLLDWEELSKLISGYENLLEEVSGDKHDPMDYTDMSDYAYYMYECDFGTNTCDEGGHSKITDEDGNEIFMRTPEELYDNFIAKRITIADKIRGMNDEELAEYLTSFYKTGYLMSGISLEEKEAGDVLEFIKQPL